MKRITAFAAASILLTGALGIGSTATAAPAPTAAPAASNAPSAAAAPSTAAGWKGCVHGKYCIYSGYDGTGDTCQWAPDKANTADGCPFIQRGAVVKSVWNGTEKTVTIYKNTNFKDRIGSTKGRTGGNLQGNYQIRSFKD